MKRLPLVILLFIGFASHIYASPQLMRKAEEFIHTAFADAKGDSIVSDSLTAAERYLRDSIRLQEMELQLQEMKLNEILLRSELDNALNRTNTADSLKMVEQRR
ncbi:MAG: mechanosensitive ion channel family protein, partial [Paramuribaculum sp.]|nr:mechanosensitive ion channel family protein [Paramuribaculum sp.]